MHRSCEVPLCVLYFTASPRHYCFNLWSNHLFFYNLLFVLLYTIIVHVCKFCLVRINCGILLWLRIQSCLATTLFYCPLGTWLIKRLYHFVKTSDGFSRHRNITKFGQLSSKVKWFLKQWLLSVFMQLLVQKHLVKLAIHLVLVANLLTKCLQRRMLLLYVQAISQPIKSVGLRMLPKNMQGVSKRIVTCIWAS